MCVNKLGCYFPCRLINISGNVWLIIFLIFRLTAFVVKCFARAITLIRDIDISILESAVQFLFSRQTKEGSFQELGRVIHTEMQVDYL